MKNLKLLSLFAAIAAAGCANQPDSKFVDRAPGAEPGTAAQLATPIAQQKPKIEQPKPTQGNPPLAH